MENNFEINTKNFKPEFEHSPVQMSKDKELKFFEKLKKNFYTIQSKIAQNNQIIANPNIYKNVFKNFALLTRNLSFVLYPNDELNEKLIKTQINFLQFLSEKTKEIAKKNLEKLKEYTISKMNYKEDKQVLDELLELFSKPINDEPIDNDYTKNVKKDILKGIKDFISNTISLFKNDKLVIRGYRGKKQEYKTIINSLVKETKKSISDKTANKEYFNFFTQNNRGSEKKLSLAVIESLIDHYIKKIDENYGITKIIDQISANKTSYEVKINHIAPAEITENKVHMMISIGDSFSKDHEQSVPVFLYYLNNNKDVNSKQKFISLLCSNNLNIAQKEELKNGIKDLHFSGLNTLYGSKIRFQGENAVVLFFDEQLFPLNPHFTLFKLSYEFNPIEEMIGYANLRKALEEFVSPNFQLETKHLNFNANRGKKPIDLKLIKNYSKCYEQFHNRVINFFAEPSILQIIKNFIMKPF